jgi:hypothetical protein
MGAMDEKEQLGEEGAVVWLAPRTPEEAADNVEAEHSDHDSDTYCNCVERMRAALTGKPDPEGRGYQYGVLHYGCKEAPKHGCWTVEEYMHWRLAEAIYSAKPDPNVPGNSMYILGLSAALSPRPPSLKSRIS